MLILGLKNHVYTCTLYSVYCYNVPTELVGLFVCVALMVAIASSLPVIGQQTAICLDLLKQEEFVLLKNCEDNKFVL